MAQENLRRHRISWQEAKSWILNTIVKLIRHELIFWTAHFQQLWARRIEPRILSKVNPMPYIQVFTGLDNILEWNEATYLVSFFFSLERKFQLEKKTTVVLSHMPCDLTPFESFTIRYISAPITTILGSLSIRHRSDNNKLSDRCLIFIDPKSLLSGKIMVFV